MFGQLQKIGKSLLYPIAMLPFAAIFLRLADVVPGGPDAPQFSIVVSQMF